MGLITYYFKFQVQPPSFLELAEKLGEYMGNSSTCQPRKIRQYSQEEMGIMRRRYQERLKLERSRLDMTPEKYELVKQLAQPRMMPFLQAPKYSGSIYFPLINHKIEVTLTHQHFLILETSLAVDKKYRDAIVREIILMGAEKIDNQDYSSQHSNDKERK